jgi:hypothetical protein
MLDISPIIISASLERDQDGLNMSAERNNE